MPESASAQPHDSPGFDFESIFAPRTVAVYGASERTSSELLGNLSLPGRRVFGVNPIKSEVCGIPCYPRVEDSPVAPDLVVIAVGHRGAEEAIDNVLALGTRPGLVVPGLGTEAGSEAPPIIERIKAKVLRAGVPMVGPNCMGVAIPHAPSPWIGRIPSTFLPGPVAVVAQSGSMASNLVGLGPRMGFRAVVSSGNEAVTDVVDFLDYFLTDPETRAVGLFLEAVRRPESFERALEQMAEARKPVIVFKSGGSELGARAALSHTGGLAGSDETFSALLRYYGAIRVNDFGDWVEHLRLFSSKRPIRGGRIGGVTASGGEAGDFADQATRAGLHLHVPSETLAARIRAEFPRIGYVGTPVDCWAAENDRVVYPRVLQLLAESGEFDVLVSLGDHSGWVEGPVAALYRNVGSDLDRVCSATDVFPCIVSVTTADPSPDDLRFSVESDVPLLKGSPSALRALASRAAYDPPARRRSRARADRVPGRGALSEFESTQLVAGCGIGHANPIRCSGADEAISAANRIGYPVVVKIHNVAHKARVGGVALNLHGDADVRDAVARIGHEVVVAKQVTGGVEVLIGAFRDRDFGPVVAVGVGGTNAEELNLAAIALAPANANDARQLVESVHPLHRLLGGEHIPECLIEAIVGVSEMVARHAEIVEVDVNPLVIHANDAIALDCLVVLDANA